MGQRKTTVRSVACVRRLTAVVNAGVELHDDRSAEHILQELGGRPLVRATAPTIAPRGVRHRGHR